MWIVYVFQNVASLMVIVSTKVLAAKWKYNNYPLLCSLHDLQLCSKRKGELYIVQTQQKTLAMPIQVGITLIFYLIARSSR